MKFTPPPTKIWTQATSQSRFERPGLHHVIIEDVQLDTYIYSPRSDGTFTCSMRALKEPGTATILIPFPPPSKHHRDRGRMAARRLGRLYIATNQIKPHVQWSVEIDDRKLVGQQLIIKLRKPPHAKYLELDADELFHVSDPRVSDFEGFSEAALASRSDELKELDEADVCYFGPLLSHDWQDYYTYYGEDVDPAKSEELFLGECTVINPASSVNCEELYALYLSWCERKKIRPEANNIFGRSVKAYMKGRINGQVRKRQTTLQSVDGPARKWFYVGLEAKGAPDE